MMKALLILICSVWCALPASAQQNYDAGLIPKDLLPYASAVIRNSDEQIEVKALDNTLVHIKQAITVLNKNGDEYARVVVWHNKSNIIKSIKGVVYNAGGKQIGKFSERDFKDINAADDAALFEDSHEKRFLPAVIDYPYTVEYEYEVRAKQTMYFDDWLPCPAAGIAIENSSYTFTSKPDFNIRYKEINTPEKVSITTDKQGLKSYTWHAGHIKAIKNEPYSPNPDRFLTMVKIAPEKFMYDGVSGGFTNWNNLGKWIYDKLLTNRDRLPPETEERIKMLTAGISDPKLKAKKVYEYMQQKTRYVSIQVGIGGFRPFLAEDVDRTGYGDCKALVNYTHALLKAAGIDSYYCVVYGDRRKKSLMPDFASMDQGNHIILCVPFKNDTTWAECTSQKMPFGFLGDFTDDRWVLACTPEGGKLLHTPHYTALTNLTKRKGDFIINAGGELSGDMTTAFSGTEFDERYLVIDEPYTEQLKAIRETYNINNLDVQKLSFAQNKSTRPVTTEMIRLKARDFAANNSGKLYFMVNLANRLESVPNEVRNRSTDVYINRGYVDEDSISYILPDGYHLDKLLLNENIEKPFGKFTVSMKLNGKQLLYERRLQVNDGTYSKDDYQALVDFYQSVADADSYTAILVKNN